MNNLPCRTFGTVRVIFDPNLIDATTGEPAEATISRETDAGENVMVLTFGSRIPHEGPGWTMLAVQLRAHAGAPDAQADSGDCAECAESRCDVCERPGGSRVAADDQRYPTCCCGRRFRTDRADADLMPDSANAELGEDEEVETQVAEPLYGPDSANAEPDEEEEEWLDEEDPDPEDDDYDDDATDAYLAGLSDEEFSERLLTVLEESSRRRRGRRPLTVAELQEHRARMLEHIADLDAELANAGESR